MSWKGVARGEKEEGEREEKCMGSVTPAEAFCSLSPHHSLNIDSDHFLHGKLVGPLKRASAFKNNVLHLPGQIVPIFVAYHPAYLYQLLLLFCLLLLENVWGLLFPSVSSWFLRAFYSQTPFQTLSPLVAEKMRLWHSG